MFFDLRNEIVLKQASLAVGIDEENPGDQSFGLKQNYPNPASSSTTIAFSIPEAGEARLAVYDLAGHKVLDLVNGQKGKGTHVIKADLSGLTTEIYFLRLDAGRLSDTKKMTVTR